MTARAALAKLLRSPNLAWLFAVMVPAVALSVSLDSQPQPKPLWTVDDLPATPATADNGWVLLDTAAFEVEIPAELRELVVGDIPADPAFWSQVEAQAPALDELMNRLDVREALARLDIARGRPAFVDDCESGEGCGTLGWMNLHRLAMLAVLQRELQGDHRGAMALVRGLVVFDRTYLEQPPSSVAVLVGIHNLRGALTLSERLLERAEGELVQQEARALRGAVAAVDVDTRVLQPMLMREYMVLDGLLDDPSDPRYGEATKQARTSSWFVDRAETRRMLAERYRRRSACAGVGDIACALGIDEEALDASPGWWLENPGGKRMLQSWQFWAPSAAEGLYDSLGRIASSRLRIIGSGEAG
ncbi:MAG: hypothetical protein KC431_12440 [Myxococcales bacterium]|nr:hypothetical protein [Myxococcales bacterium]